MKTIVHIELDDTKRRLLAVYLTRDPATKHLVTRKEVTELVCAFVSERISRAYQGEYDGYDEDIPDTPDSGRPGRDNGHDGSAGHQGLPDDADPVASFTPSRGDEPYLYTGRNNALTGACTEMLDIAARVDQLIWEALEGDRVK